MTDVHALGDDREHCKTCRRDWPCPGWLAQLRAEVEPWARLGALETYRPPLVPPHVTERLRAALSREMS